MQYHHIKKNSQKSTLWWKVVLCIIVIVGVYGYYQYTSTLEGFSGGKERDIYIEKGSSVSQIIELLYQEGIISHKWPVSLYLKSSPQASKIQAGDFRMTQGVSIENLLEALTHPKSIESSLLIKEGSTIEDIDQLLTQNKLIQSGEFIASAKNGDFSEFSFISQRNLEGYLFPDTYFINPKQFSSEDFIKRMLKNFEKTFLTASNKQQMSARGEDLKSIVIMASIIEKEESNAQNLGLVSGILWKRLEEKIPLGADATTRYYLKNTSGDLLKSDFEDSNPYNTRRHLGLPPTAISSPGIKALEASLYPINSKYYYYLHDAQGKIHFAETNDEHNRNRQKYLQ